MSFDVPDGWQVTSIGEVAAITMGQSPPSSVVNNDGDGLPFIQGNAEFGARYPTPRQFAADCPKVVEAGDVLLSVRAPVGEVNVAAERLCIGRGLAGLRPINGHHDFLYFALCGLAPVFARLSQGSTFDAINGKDLRSIPLFLPPLDEQRRIAEVLRSVDEAIAATQSTVQAATTVRQVALDALIQRVLDDPEIEIRPLSEIAKVRTGLAKNKNRTGLKVQVPYLRVANVQDGWFDLSDMQEIEVDPGQVDRYLLQAGDVMLTEGGDYDKLGRGGVWRGEIAPCLHQNHVFCVRPDTTALLPEYFALATQSAWGRAYFLTCAKRTTNLASINSSQLRAFPVPIIATTTQARLIEEVAGIDAMIDLEERQLDILLRLRAEVSSDLLSGNVRVAA